MKVLSIKQPWAFLIIHGYTSYYGSVVKHIKDIENRTWNTKLRGRFLVHAGKQLDKEAWRYFQDDLNPDDMQRGGIIGSVELVDVITESNSRWFQGPFGFVLKDPEPMKFIPLKGQLGFFNYDLNKNLSGQLLPTGAENEKV